MALLSIQGMVFFLYSNSECEEMTKQEVNCDKSVPWTRWTKTRAKESINYIISYVTQKAVSCAGYVSNKNLICQLIIK